VKLTQENICCTLRVRVSLYIHIQLYIYIHTCIPYKGKVVLLQVRCGPEGSRGFILPDFHDIRHMKVVRSSALRTVRLYLQESSWYSFSLGVDSTPGAMMRSEGDMSLKIPVIPPGIDPGTVRLVAQRLNH
jgi:hypothetical protein